MPTMRGTITIVQESRFQLTDDSGVGHHFVLGHASAAEPDSLPPLRFHRVSVDWRDADNTLAKLARRIVRED